MLTFFTVCFLCDNLLRVCYSIDLFISRSWLYLKGEQWNNNYTSFQAIQRQLSPATVAAGPAGAAAGGRGRAPVLGRRAPGAARAHEQTLRGDARGLSAVDHQVPSASCPYKNPFSFLHLRRATRPRAKCTKRWTDLVQNLLLFLYNIKKIYLVLL